MVKLVPSISGPRRYRVWPMPTMHAWSLSEAIRSSHNCTFTTIDGAKGCNEPCPIEYHEAINLSSDILQPHGYGVGVGARGGVDSRIEPMQKTRTQRTRYGSRC